MLNYKRSIQSIDEWDLEIRSKRRVLDINIREIWQYRDLAVLFVRRDLVAKYKQTILGPLWFLVNPLLSALLYSVVFNGIANIPTEGIPPMIFYMTGVTAWMYFSTCLTGTSSTFISNAGIFGKVYFPRLIIPISIVISTLVQFLIQFVLLLVIIFFYIVFKGFSLQINYYALLIPYLVFLLAIFGLGFGIIVSALTTKYRDLSNLMTFSVQLWMYITPIVYPLSSVDSKYRTLMFLNPITSIIEGFKFGLLGSGIISFHALIYSTIFIMITLVCGVLLFNKVEQSFMDTI